MEIANSENVDKETIRQHDDIMNRHQMLSGGETALFFAAEQKDFKFSGLLLLFILKQTDSFHLFMLSMTSNLEWKFSNWRSLMIIWFMRCTWDFVSTKNSSLQNVSEACLVLHKRKRQLKSSWIIPISSKLLQWTSQSLKLRKKHRKEVLGILKPNGGPSSSYFK